MKTKIVQGERKCKLVCNLPSRRLFKALPKIVQAGRNPKFFCGLLAVVRRGPQGFLHYLAAKSTKNSPTVAFACFVPSNVRNGRLFAGAHAPRPRFLSLLAGPSFDGSGIEPDSFAAKGGVRRGATTGSETQYSAIASGSGSKPPHYRLQRRSRESDMRMVLVLLTSKVLINSNYLIDSIWQKSR